MVLGGLAQLRRHVKVLTEERGKKKEEKKKTIKGIKLGSAQKVHREAEVFGL